MKLSLKQLKQLINEEVGKNDDHWQRMGFGKPAPHEGPSFADTVSEPHNGSYDLGGGKGMGSGGAAFEDEFVDDEFDQPLGADEFDGDELEGLDEPPYGPTYESIRRHRKLNERSMGEVTGALRKTLNTCSNYVSDMTTFVKTKRPDWEDTMQALRTAEKAIEAAHQSLLEKE